MTRFRRLGAVVAMALAVATTTAVPAAQAAQGPTIGNPSVTRVYHGATFAVVGFAAPGATVVLHYHRAGTPASDFSIERSVRAASDGFWFREAKLDVDYRVFATVGTGNPHSATVLFTATGATPPRITNPAETALPFGQPYVVKGTAAPFTQLQLHFRRTTAPGVDIVRTVNTGQDGAWSRRGILDASYTVYATVGTGNPHSATVRFTGHDATVGDTLDIDYAPTSGPRDHVLTTVGTQLRSYVPAIDSGNTSVDHVDLVRLCVRNRGPRVFTDDPDRSRSMVLVDELSGTWGAGPWVGETEPRINLTSMAVGELRCGSLTFPLPGGVRITSFVYSPGLVANHYAGTWDLPTLTAVAGGETAAGKAATVPTSKPAVATPREVTVATARISARS